jgi:hypothetical protein
MSVRRPLASLLTASALVLSVSGCGGDAEETSAESSPSPSTSSSAAEEPTDEPSEEPTDETDGLSEDAQAFLDRLKAGMGEEGSMHVEMEMTGPAEMSAQGDSAYGPDGSEMHLTMQMAAMPGGDLEMVLVDGKAYMSMPGVNQPGEFFEIDESNPSFGSLDDGLSPTDSFAAFEAGLQSVEDLGDDTIDGDQTRHYRLEVGAEEALDATGQAMVPGLPETLVYDVWLDSEDRMRRLTYELVGTELTMDMTDWGKPVEIEPPAPGDIVDPPPGI